MTQEMALAKQVLCEEGATCVLYKEAKVRLSGERGVKPLLVWLEEKENPLMDACVADKVIGKAAAMLMVYGRVKEVYAHIISEPAARCFDEYHIPYCFGQMTGRIANREGTGLCPMEERCIGIDDAQEAYRILRESVLGKKL